MSVRIWLHEQRDAETERMALRSRMLLEQRGHAVAGEDADAVIGNRSSYTELIGSQSRQLVLHARFLVERRQLYSEIGIGDHRGLKMFERLVDKPERNSQRRSDEFRFVGGFVQRHGQQTALFVAQADSGIRKPVVVDGEPQIGGEVERSGSCSGRPAPASPKRRSGRIPQFLIQKPFLFGGIAAVIDADELRKAEFAAVKKVEISHARTS